MKLALHWFRRDLRVTDNTALGEAARRAERILPVFIVEDPDPAEPDAGPVACAFLWRSLGSLQANLEALGYSLIIRRGPAEAALPKLCREAKAEAVFCNRLTEPAAQSRDHRVFNALNGMGIGFEVLKDAVIWEEGEVLTQAGKPFTVFTPYAKAWKSRKPAPPRPRLPPARTPFPKLASEPVPADPPNLSPSLARALPVPGERAAQQLLREFMRGPLFSYAAHRDFPALDGTSHLSPHLRCGTIGIRTVVARLTDARANASSPGRTSCDIFLNELIWREFYHQILANFPHVAKGSFRQEYDALRWSDNREHFQAWCDGQTGYPIVDAAMRCLNATGWLHNRLRMITAMFLTKDLLIDWRWGERDFMHQLVDADRAANNGGWQWSAGTGTDAAPYFRIFNPVTQGKRFDPEGDFVRKWVPELSSLPPRIIHEPWRNPTAPEMRRYPKRLVLHEEQRPRCLALYQAVRPPMSSS